MGQDEYTTYREEENGPYRVVREWVADRNGHVVARREMVLRKKKPPAIFLGSFVFFVSLGLLAGLFKFIFETADVDPKAFLGKAAGIFVLGIFVVAGLIASWVCSLCKS